VVRDDAFAQAGTRALALASPFGRLALSVCYDVRFPELYRALGNFDIMFVPSAFTVPTGAAHWETLLRSRAIENQAYVVAPAQGGLHPGGRRTYGHTMIVDPWGEVLGVRPEGEGVLLAEKSGIARETAVEVLLNSVIASPMVKYRGPFVLEMPEEAWFDVNMMQKDLLLALELGRQLDVPLPTTAVTNEMLTTARGMGLAKKDFAILFQVLAQMSGLKL